jgi:hypothetical protein
VCIWEGNLLEVFDVSSTVVWHWVGLDGFYDTRHLGLNFTTYDYAPRIY